MRFLNRQNIKKNGLLTCSRTGDNKEMRNQVTYTAGITDVNILHNSLKVMSDELNRSLALFVCKVREVNGSKYPPNTLHGVFIYYTLFYSRLYFSSPSLEPGALKCPKSTCWYSNMPVGHNKLASAVKRLCEQTGISGYRTKPFTARHCCNTNA